MAGGAGPEERSNDNHSFVRWGIWQLRGIGAIRTPLSRVYGLAIAIRSWTTAYGFSRNSVDTQALGMHFVDALQKVPSLLPDG